MVLAVRPRHAVLTDPAALAVRIDAAAEDVAELAVLAVPAEVPAVVTLARSAVARAYWSHGYLVAGQPGVAVDGGDVGGEDEEEEEEDREQGQKEVGPGGHCDKILSNVWFGIKLSSYSYTKDCFYLATS